MSGGAGVVVLGAGGHAKIVIATLREAGFQVVTVLDDDPSKRGASVLGALISGPLSALSTYRDCAVIAIGENRKRRELAQRFPGREWPVVVHPFAVVDGSAHLGPGTLVCAGGVVQPEARVGSHCIVNTGATIDHDCVLGDYVHVAPGSHLAAGVRLDEGVLLGVGGVVRPGAAVGAWTVVGAGGVVVDDLPAGVTAVGVPAAVRPDA